MKIRRKQRFPVIYLSGPMTGIENFNRAQFDAAATTLRSLGYDVFVPGESEEYEPTELAAQEVSRKKRELYLSRDIDFIQEIADVVVVLPGWEDSEGAKLEVAVAQAIGVPVFTFPDATLLRSRVSLVVT